MGSRGNAFHAVLLCLALFAFSESATSVRGQQPAPPPLEPFPANPAERQAEIEKLQLVLGQARKSGDAPLEAKTLFQLGRRFIDPGQSHQAIDAFSRAVLIYEKLGDRLGAGLALHGMAQIYLARGDLDNTLYYCRQAFPYLQGNLVWEPQLLGLTASAHLQAWHLQSALDGFTLALQEFQHLPHTLDQFTLPKIAFTMGDLGRVSFLQGDKAKGLDYFNQALAIARQIGDRSLEAHTLNGMGLAYIGIGESRNSIEYFRQALQISQAIGDRQGESASLAGIGGAQESLGDLSEALNDLNQVRVMERSVGDRAREAGVLRQICETYEHAGQHQKAVDFCSQALAIFRKIADPEGEAGVLNYMGNIYIEHGEPQKALALLDQGVAVSRKSGDRQSEAIALFYTGAVYLELGQSVNALAYFNQAGPLVKSLGGGRSHESHFDGDHGILISRRPGKTAR